MAQPTRPGNTERGWNDPPMFLQSGKPGSPVRAARVSLTQRVGHPGLSANTTAKDHESGDGSSTANSGPPRTAPPVGSIMLLPPTSSIEIPKFTAPIIVPTMSPPEKDHMMHPSTATNPVTNTQVNIEGTDLEIPNFNDDEQIFHYVISRLIKVLTDCKSVIKPKVVDDINKKLDILSNMWEEGKLSYPVKSDMARLATALHKRKCDMAHKIHLGLMMDYISEVSQWMVGIKRLIQEARNVEAPLSPTDMVSSTPQEQPANTTCMQPSEKPSCESHNEHSPVDTTTEVSSSCETMSSCPDNVMMNTNSSSSSAPLGTTLQTADSTDTTLQSHDSQATPEVSASAES